MNDPITQLILSYTWDDHVTVFECWSGQLPDFCDEDDPPGIARKYDALELQTTGDVPRRLAIWVELDGPSSYDEHPDYILSHAVGYALMLNDANPLDTELIDCASGDVIREFRA